MVKYVELEALREFQNSVGIIAVGERFKVSTTMAESLLREKLARYPMTIHTTRAQSAKSGIWAGAKVVIIAGGPSLMVEDLELIKRWREDPDTKEQRIVMVLNTTFQTVPWADVLYAADYKWWNYYHEEVEDMFRGERVSPNEEVRKKYKTTFIQCERRPGLSAIPKVIHSGGNSGYQAIGLAAERGADGIVLVAYDMQRTGGQSHHHGNHPKELNQGSPFKTWLASFKALARDLKTAKIRVVNSSRETALEEFDRLPLSEALGM